MITGKDLIQMESSIPRSKYRTNEMYYNGNNSGIIDAPRKRKPDNRVPVAFANRLVKNLAGYAARIGDVRIEFENATDQQELLYSSIKKENYTDILNSLLYKNCLKHGVSYDMVWTEEKEGELQIRVSDIPIVQCLPIWEDSLSVVPVLKNFVRYFNASELEINGELIKSGHYAQVFYRGGYQLWWLCEANARSKDRAVPRLLLEQEQPFTDVQVNAYFANDEEMPYWQPVRDLIDQFDKVISGNMNEADRFNDTWLMMMQKVQPETKRKIDEMGIIDDLQNVVNDVVSGGDAYPRFLERNIPVEHSRMMIETLENMIYTIIGVPSFLDEQLGAASGVSLLFRLIGLEYAATETDVYFDIGLHQRHNKIMQALESVPTYNGISTAGMIDLEPVVNRKRNIPMDKASILKEAIDLKILGVSMETILKYLPTAIIEDVSQELQNIEAAQPSVVLPEDADI